MAPGRDDRAMFEEASAVSLRVPDTPAVDRFAHVDGLATEVGIHPAQRELLTASKPGLQCHREHRQPRQLGRCREQEPIGPRRAQPVEVDWLGLQLVDPRHVGQEAPLDSTAHERRERPQVAVDRARSQPGFELVGGVAIEIAGADGLTRLRSLARRAVVDRIAGITDAIPVRSAVWSGFAVLGQLSRVSGAPSSSSWSRRINSSTPSVMARTAIGPAPCHRSPSGTSVSVCRPSHPYRFIFSGRIGRFRAVQDAGRGDRAMPEMAVSTGRSASAGSGRRAARIRCACGPVSGSPR